MSYLRNAFASNEILLFDGAYGTLLQERGMPVGQSPELFGLENPQVVLAAHRDYLAAGARLLTTNTFGGSRPKLGADVDVAGLNRHMAQLACQAAEGRAWVAGSVGPTGVFMEPLGLLSFRDLVDIFTEQIRGLAEGGVQLIKAETHFDLAEVKAVVVAARQVARDLGMDLPVMACMTFEGMATLTGTTPESFVDTMQNLGVEALGINCGAGPEQMAALARRMLPRLETPLHLQPNAGMPVLVDGKTVFPLGPQAFAQECLALAALGAKCIGGCCGSGPAHIAALSAAVAGTPWQKPVPTEPPALALTTRGGASLLGPGRPLAIIGERINPTGKKLLAEELQGGIFTEALRLATDQLRSGAAVLDVNVGAPMVDEPVVLPGLCRSLSERFQAPLAIDTTDPAAMAASLWAMAGSPLVNSISGEPGRMERLGPLCRDLGAPFILLPLKGKSLPVAAAERIAIIEELVEQADGLGIPRRLILVDALALTVSSKPEGAKACLDVIAHCTKVLGLPTVLGLSNISFGLPARELVNATFLSMCMANGLCACIANPDATRLREALAAGEVLLARDPAAARFIAGFGQWKPAGGVAAASTSSVSNQAASVSTPRQAVVAGAKERLAELLETALEAGTSAIELVNEELIPGILEVGDRYERREYFLPQLMLSAEAMQRGFERLKPLLEETAGQLAKPKIILATVEGDIHDIGKNIVALLLKNHGFEVIDLGKDVPVANIVAAARQEQAGLIGLSALMTTTMVRMQDVVREVRAAGLPSKVIVGGAVVTEAFAERIGADGYAADAVAAARLAKRLTEA